MRINLDVQLLAAEARRNEAKWVRSPEEAKARCAELDKEIASLLAATQRAPVEQGRESILTVEDVFKSHSFTGWDEQEESGSHRGRNKGWTEWTRKLNEIIAQHAAAPDHAREGALREEKVQAIYDKWAGWIPYGNGPMFLADLRALADGKEGGE